MVAVVGDKDAGAGWIAVLREMFVGARAATLRFPVTTLFLLAAAVQANLMAADIRLLPESEGGSALNFSLVCGLAAGAMASLAATLSGEARGYSALARMLAASAAAAPVCIIMTLEEPLLTVEWTLMLALAGLIPVAPFIGRGSGASFWMFAARTAFALLLGVLALLLFAGGISAILASLTYLFDIEVSGQLYEHVWFGTALFAAPLFGLGQLPGRFDERPGDFTNGFMDRGMRALGDFVAAPLLILYAVILHLYALKIVLTGEVPEGQIGWLVLVYGMCIFGALLIINPFFDRARAPTRAFLRLWPFFLPIPQALLFYALFLRVGEFGVTPERFLLGLFGIVTTIVLLLQVFPRLRGDIRIIAGLPVVALIFTSFGPQGALGVSLSSQAHRFLAIVESPPVEGEREEEALSALAFLAGRHATTRVWPEGKENAPAEEGEDSPFMATAKAWGLDPRYPNTRSGSFVISGHDPAAFTVDGFDAMVENLSLSVRAQDPVSVELPSGREISFALAENAVSVTVGADTVSFPISMQELERFRWRNADSEPVELHLASDGRRLLLVISRLYGKTGESPGMQSLQATVLLRERDWAAP